MTRQRDYSGIRIFISAALLVACSSVSGNTSDYGERDGRFFERSAEGWFFYEPEPIPEKKTKPKEKTEVAEKPVETMKQPESDAIPAPVQTVQPPKNFSIQWFRENVNKYRDRAIDNPTPENVSAFLYVQKMALDKSHKFANTWEKVVLSNPELDANSRRPLASGGSFAVDSRAKANKQATLKNLSADAGIWFFYSSESPYAAQQAEVLFALSKQLGFSVLPISLDGLPLPSGRFPEFVEDQGQAKVVGVQQVPATYMVAGDGTIKPLGEGVISYNDMQERLLVVAQINGLITEEEYQQAQPLLSNNLDLPQKLSTSLEEKGRSGFIEPAELLEHIEKASGL